MAGISEELLRLIFDSLYYTSRKPAEKPVKEESKLEKKIEEKKSDSKMIFFRDAKTVFDDNIHDILDDISRLGLNNGKFTPMVDNASISELLMIFNRWININQANEEIFGTAENLESGVMSAPGLTSEKSMNYSSFYPEEMYASFPGEERGAGYEGTRDSIYMAIEKRKLEPNED